MRRFSTKAVLALVLALVMALACAVPGLAAETSIPYEGDSVNFIKEDGSQFGMFTPQDGTTVKLDGDTIAIHFVPKNTTVYNGIHFGSIDDAELTADVAANEDGTYDITLSADKTGTCIPVAPIKAKDGATTKDQYYLAIPAADKLSGRTFRCAVSPQTLTVDGEEKTCEKYNIDGNNFFKLRDLAALLDGTTSQFSVDFDQETGTAVITTGAPYTTKDGTELADRGDLSAKIKPSTQTVEIDGEKVELQAYYAAGSNFFKLRDLAPLVHFYVHYDKATNTAIVEQQDEDEDWTTGDASLDKPRNEDGIGEKELLVVSFGTSFNDSRVKTIGAIEEAMEKAFPELSVRRGFTANIVIDHVYRRDDKKIDDINEALDRAVANGVKELYVQPTHLMNGIEYDEIIEKLAKYSDSFEIKVGAPLLTSDEDFEIVRDAIVEATKEYDDGKTAIVFMGHGTEHASNAVYAKMQGLMPANYFIGTVEAEPSVEDVLALVKEGGYEKVVLRPLMIVAGDHANNDMADEEDPESWYSIFKAAGFEVECVLEGLGQLPEIQDLLVAHAMVAVNGRDVNLPTRDVAGAGEMIAVDEVVEEGMVAVPGEKLNDGTYDVTVKTSSSMFKIKKATLTVADGKMTAEITMNGKSYTWFFMGEADKIADADDSEFIPAVVTDDEYSFTIPVEALDASIACASYSKNKDQWYARSILFRADSLPEGALKEKLGTDPASLELTDGEYTVEVALGGGSGKTSITSPAKLVVADGKLTATIIFSSSKYDWVKLGETQYDAVTTDPGSTFELPVEALDVNIAFVGHTTAMGGQEISYTLNFDSATVKAAK